MNRVRQFLYSIPTGVWAFIAFTQIVGVPVSYYKMSHFSELANKYRSEQGMEEMADFCLNAHHSNKRWFISTLILAPVASALTYWKMAEGKAIDQQHN